MVTGVPQISVCGVHPPMEIGVLRMWCAFTDGNWRTANQRMWSASADGNGRVAYVECIRRWKCAVSRFPRAEQG
ncbi:MAG: hypothetical protein IKD29_03705 [Lentisphaeria bacterium]|nr:hypothetical protein [Lentisphaeria bacterium]